MALAPGATFGRYRIVGPLGRGGMASVFEAHEPELDRRVALKVLPAEFLHDPTFAERFRREARVVARLEHPHIVPIYAFGIDDGIPWMAMRLVEGGALSTRLRRERLAPSETVRILTAVSAALEHAHERGVLHRDVKPQNILLDREGHPYLADFGVARIVESSTLLTQPGAITGTPQYMAPEQASGGPLDRRCDVYALAIVAYEMLAGAVPFSADTPVAVLMKHLSEPIPMPPRDTVPEALLRPVLKALAKDPAERWSSARDFATALERGLRGGPAPTAQVDVRGPVAASQDRAAGAERASTGSAPSPSRPAPRSSPTRGGRAVAWLLEHAAEIFVAGAFVGLLAALVSAQAPTLAIGLGSISGLILYMGFLLGARQRWQSSRVSVAVFGLMFVLVGVALVIAGSWQGALVFVLAFAVAPALLIWIGRSPRETTASSRVAPSGPRPVLSRRLLQGWLGHPWWTFWIGLILLGALSAYSERWFARLGFWLLLAVVYAGYVQGVRLAFATSRPIGVLIVLLAVGLTVVPLLAGASWVAAAVALLVTVGGPVLAEALVRRWRPPGVRPEVPTPSDRAALAGRVFAGFVVIAAFFWALTAPQRNASNTVRGIRPGMTLGEVLGAARGRCFASGRVGTFEEGKPAPPELYVSRTPNGRYSLGFGGRGYGSDLTAEQLNSVLISTPEIRTPAQLRIVFLGWSPGKALVLIEFDGQGRVTRISPIGGLD